jgi:hypothetical protein
MDVGHFKLGLLGDGERGGEDGEERNLIHRQRSDSFRVRQGKALEFRRFTGRFVPEIGKACSIWALRG